MGNSFSQNHSGSGDNIMNVGEQRFDMTNEVMNQITAKLRPNEAVSIVYTGFGRSPIWAQKLENFLRGRGFDVHMAGGGQISISGIVHSEPVTHYPHGLFAQAGITFDGGMQAVFIDASLA